MVESVFLAIGMAMALSVAAVALLRLGDPSEIDSVSNVSYILGKSGFSVWIMLLGVTLLPAMMSALDSSAQWVGFLSVAGLFCVASTPSYKTTGTALHWAGGTAWFVLSLAVVAMVRPAMLLGWLAYPPLLCVEAVRKSFVFYAEMACYLILSAALMSRLL